MRMVFSSKRLTATLLVAIFACSSLHAQAPSSIQFFLPDGSLPGRELRFTLTSDTGLVDIFYTDNRGRFLITRSQGLRPDATYTVTVQGDGRAFSTTIQTFKMYAVGHITVFLRPVENQPAGFPGSVDLAELDVKTPKEARDAYDSAMRSFREGQTNTAIKELKRALDIYPNYFRALNDLGVILMQSKRLDEAAEIFERATKLAPRVYLPRLNLGIIRTKQARYKEAIEVLDKLHKENPAFIEVRAPLADALMAAGKLDQAETHLRAALGEGKLDRGAEGNARYLLGLLLNRKQKFEEAVRELGQAAKLLPSGSRIRFQLGAALLQMKRFDEAERELQEAYRLSGPELGAAQFLLGELYFLTKRYDNAMRAFEQYLVDVPEAPNAEVVRGLINKIKAAISQK
jgi:tetratricopeptide (TPR) repeat protein